MDFEVSLTLRAQADIEEAVAFIAADSTRHAQRWFSSLDNLVSSLRSMPMRFPVIAESAELGRPLRSVSHYSHRVVYEVNESDRVVTVIRIYHSARKPLSADELH